MDKKIEDTQKEQIDKNNLYSWRGTARRGEARRGEAWRGMARSLAEL